MNLFMVRKFKVVITRCTKNLNTQRLYLLLPLLLEVELLLEVLREDDEEDEEEDDDDDVEGAL